MEMHKYRALSVITLESGTEVMLSPKSAADRRGRLTRIDGDVYRLNEALQIKAGEEFVIEGEIAKHLANQVEHLNPKKDKGPTKEQQRRLKALQEHAEKCAAAADAAVAAAENEGDKKKKEELTNNATAAIAVAKDADESYQEAKAALGL